MFLCLSNGSTHRSNFSGAPSAHTKAILKIKQADENDRHIKATFTDNEGNQVKELVPIFRDSDPGELLLELEKELLNFGSRYDLFQDGRWKMLSQIGGRALKGRIGRIWRYTVDSKRFSNYTGPVGVCVGRKQMRTPRPPLHWRVSLPPHANPYGTSPV